MNTLKAHTVLPRQALSAGHWPADRGIIFGQLFTSVDSDQTSWVQIPAPSLSVGPKLYCLGSWRVCFVRSLGDGSTYLTACRGV